MINYDALFKVSYGLYIVCSGNKDRGNGFISNTVFQVTSEPARFAACCNKNNFTAEFIQKYRTFSVSVLHVNAPAELFGRFGYQSGRVTDKMAGLRINYGDTGVPIVLNASIAYLECSVIQTVDVGTHWIFIGDLINSGMLDETAEPMTYQYYKQVRKAVAPKNAPTYVDQSKIDVIKIESIHKKYKCPACGYIYDESVEKIKFIDLPDDWICPICGSWKSEFIEI